MYHDLEIGYLSELKPEDLADDCISEVELDLTNVEYEALENADNVPLNPDTGLTNLVKSLEQQTEEENLEFMTDFVKMFATDPDQAKAMYYSKKVHFDINTPEG